MIYIYMISGWWFEPLWKISVNWDDYSLYMRKLFQTTNQSHYTSHFMYIPLYIPWIYHWCPMNLRTYVYIYIHIIFENTYSIYIYIYNPTSLWSWSPPTTPFHRPFLSLSETLGIRDSWTWTFDQLWVHLLKVVPTGHWRWLPSGLLHS